MHSTEIKMININIGMPEFLLIFSLGIYNDSQTFSMVAFCIAILASVSKFAMQNKDSIEDR